MIVLYIAQSVDGFVARPDGAIDWLDPFNDPNAETTYPEFLKSIDVIIMGRKSYDQILTFGEWPYTDKKCYVFTTGEMKKPPSNADVTRAEGDVKTFVSRTCQDKRVWLLGGAGLFKAFMEAKLVDEYIIGTIPVIIGSGIPLFSTTNVHIDLKCTQSKLLSSGIVENRYVMK